MPVDDVFLIFFVCFSKSKAQTGPALPSHWPTNVLDGQRIPIKDLSVIANMSKRFLAELGATCRVLSVEEVCNPTFYLKYQ